jgi:hexokinase
MTLIELSGSMTDVPKDLLAEIKRLEDMFTVPAEKLRAITDHFVDELTKGKSCADIF